MDLNVILIIVFAVVGVALIWLLVELALMVREGRKSVGQLVEKTAPLIDDAGQIVSDLKPTVAKLDPMMDRLNLTVDAANLELMRVDKIMEDVGVITEAAANATSAIDEVAQAPVAVVGNVSKKIRSAFSPSAASSTSAALAEGKRAAQAAEGDQGEAVVQASQE